MLNRSWKALKVGLKHYNHKEKERKMRVPARRVETQKLIQSVFKANDNGTKYEVVCEVTHHPRHILYELDSMAVYSNLGIGGTLTLSML